MGTRGSDTHDVPPIYSALRTVNGARAVPVAFRCAPGAKIRLPWPSSCWRFDACRLEPSKLHVGIWVGTWQPQSYRERPLI